MAHILGSSTEKSVGRSGGMQSVNRAMTVAELASLQTVGAYGVSGLTADLNANGIQMAPGQWLDATANKSHAIIPDGARVLEPKQAAPLKGVNTFTASAVGQHILNVDTVVLPLNSLITIRAMASISGTFDIGDGVDQDYYAAGVTIGTTWAAVTQLKMANDGTNRKIVITPTSSYTGVVNTLVRVEKL